MTAKNMCSYTSFLSNWALGDSVFRFFLTPLLLWCSCNRLASSQSRISPPGSPLPLGHSNAAAASTGLNWKIAPKINDTHECIPK